MLPEIKTLYGELTAVGKDVELAKLQKILNAEPKKEWIKQHPFVSNYKYIPVERQEFLMTMIFGRWRIEVLDTKIIANSVAVTVRVHYMHPVYKEWDYIDGVGAMPIQVDKGSGATDFQKMKTSAIQMSLPSAKTYAFKDAVETLGKIFGKDLNRKELISYGGVESNSFKKVLKMVDKFKNATDEDKEKFLETFNDLSVEEIDILRTKLYGLA